MANPFGSNYDTYSPYAIAAANNAGIDPGIFLWQIGQESGWNPNAKSSTSSASGIAQFINGTAKWLGVDRSDPIDSLNKAAQYNASLLNVKFAGDYLFMLNSYGTTANNPAKQQQALDVIGGIRDQFNNSINDPNSAYGQSITGQAQNKVSSAASSLVGLISRIPLIIIGLIFLAGAIYLYKSN